MVEIREDVVEELDKHQETMRLPDFVRIVEAHQPADQRGVDLDALAAYAEEVYFDVDVDAIAERTTDSEEWTEGEHFYEVGEGRISVYPLDWHDELGDSSDLKRVIEVVQTEVTEPEGDQFQAVTDERGVPEEKVLRIAETVANIDRETSRQELKELRKNDEIEEFASQGRNPTIRLS